MESEDLLLNDDDPNLEEGDVDHSLEGVDVDGLLGDDDQNMGTQNEEDVDTEVTAEAEEYYENEQGEEYIQEEEEETTAENHDEEVIDGAEAVDGEEAETEESMEEEGPSSASVTVNSNSNVCRNNVE